MRTHSGMVLGSRQHGAGKYRRKSWKILEKRGNNGNAWNQSACL